MHTPALVGDQPHDRWAPRWRQTAQCGGLDQPEITQLTAPLACARLLAPHQVAKLKVSQATRMGDVNLQSQDAVTSPAFEITIRSLPACLWV
jgi:hypothetical protein